MNRVNLSDSSGHPSKRHSKIAVRARNINIIIILLVLALVTVVTVFTMSSVSNGIANDIARSYSVEAAEKFYSYINQDLVLVRKSAKSKAVTEWFANENNQEMKLAAYNEMMDYIGLLQNAMLYFGIEKPNRNQYFIPEGITIDKLVPNDRAKLEEGNPVDAWYFACLSPENKNEYVLNIDIADGTDIWQLWINHKVFNGSEATGVFCSGLMIDSILQEMFGQYDNQYLKGYLINKNGVIIMDSTFSKEYGIKNIHDEIGDFKFSSVLDEYLENIDAHFERNAQPEIIRLEKGDFDYVSIAPITDSDWSIVVLAKNKSFSGFASIKDILPLPLILLVALFLYVLLQNTALNRLIFKPLNSLTQSISEITDNTEIFGSDRDDEIGELSRTILNATLEQNHLKNLLYAGSDATAILLATEDGKDFETSFLSGMELIGRSLDVDRVQLWRNEVIDGEVNFVHMYEWLSEYGRSCSPVPIGLAFPYSAIPEWEKMLLRNEYINSPFSKISQANQEFLKSFEMKTIVIIPLFLQNKFWGFFSIDDCKRERTFTEDEVNVLHSASYMMTNALLRNEMMQDIRAGAAKLESTASRLKAVVANYPGVICAADKSLQITLFDGLLLPNLLDNAWFVEGQTIESALQRDEYKHIMGRVFKTFEEGVQDWTFGINNKVFHMTTTPIVDAGGSIEGVVGRIDDVTEMTRLQEQIKVALEEAKEASLAKSEFLSKMSHEIRTPMNAIIGMAQIAAKTSEVDKLKYCLSTIEASSTHLLGIINDILDMSKIEAGKLELDHSLMNIEKMLIRVCNLIIEKVEQKNIMFNIVLGKNMRMHYISDELRLSQVITNLLSNAVKFTPVGGNIELTAEEVEIGDDYSVLQISVKDTGIGMTEEQIVRLFNAFEQAEAGTARKFGGTGLGLSISKSIVENMGGRIWVESKPEKGSKFTFEVKLDRPQYQNGSSVIFSSIKPSDIKLLIADPIPGERDYFKSIVNSFGITTVDEVENIAQALDLSVKAREMHKPYDIIFVDYTLADEKAIEFVKNSRFKIEKSNVIIMTTFLNWNKVEHALNGIGVNHFIPKPLFPSSILNMINEIIGGTAKNLDITAENEAEEAPDFSNVNLLFVEDVDINREIFFALLEETKLNIDVAENGLTAVEKFKNNYDKYDMIIMDIQMPEMDGYEATRTIRALDIERAKTIPIIAMTANVFREDIEKCLESGMNDHLSKPIEVDVVMNKIKVYCNLE